MNLTPLRSRIDRFAGLSDRSVPVNLTRIESPDLLNVEFAGRALERRNGYSRLHTNQMRDASARLDGRNDYIQIGNKSGYTPSGANGLYVGFATIMRQRPATTATVYCFGNTAADANQMLKITYNSTAGTGSLGAWVFTLYDLAAATLRTITVDDADPVGKYRFVECFRSLDTEHTGKITSEAGAAIASSTATWTAGGGYSTNTDDIVVGVSMSAADTISSDFYNGSVAELRIYVGSIINIASRVVTQNGYYISEIPDTSVTDYTGYWRMNDGTAENKIRDFTTTANHGYIPQNPPSWITDGTLVLGQSGLRFKGGSCFIDISDSGTGFADIFASASAQNRWTVRGLFAPELAPNETTVRAQTILWAGNHATNPEPVAIYVNASEQFEAIYNDGGTIRTCTITTTVGGLELPRYLANNALKCRWAFTRKASGTGHVQLFVGVYASSTWTVYSSSQTACTNATAGSVDTRWAIGRHVTTFTLPQIFGTNAIDGPAWGVIDDVQIVYTNNTGANQFVGVGQGPPNLYGANGAFAEVNDWSAIAGDHQTRFYLKLNEGAGNVLSVLGGSTFTAKIFPEESDGIRWDVGMVNCYRAPETQLIYDYKRWNKDGDFKQSKLAISGCTLYEIDETTSLAEAKAANLLKGGKWTATQYGQLVFLAAANGARPLKYDGDNIDYLGIRAPLLPPVVAVSNTAPGTFSGTYWVYYTYRNSRTGRESNPSPGVLATFSAGNDTIDSIQLLTSSDPQVDQRRIYIGLASGAENGSAFLATNGTIDDNVTINYGTDITTPPTSGTAAVFTGRDEAPQASVVKVSQDFLFVAGNQVYPTRVYRSNVGSPDYFTQSSLYVDLDLDSGDPVVAMESLNRQVFVSMRDGSALLWETGDSNAPVGKEILSRDHGSVGPAAYVSINGLIYYVTERDIWRTNGETEENISAPPNQLYPSIQTYMRTYVDASRRKDIVAAQHRGKNQAWFAFTSAGGTRNDRVLVYDWSQGIWSLYDLPLDYVATVEDATDDDEVWGAIEGFVCKLDTGSSDGPVSTDGSLSAGVTAQTTIAITVLGLTTNAAKGQKIQIQRASQGDVISRTILSNTSAAVVVDSAVTASNADLITIGGISWYADFVLDFGDPLRQKRLNWIRMSGTFTTDCVIRISYKAGVPGRTFTYSGVTEAHKQIVADSDYFIKSIGGLGYSYRFRIGECASSAGVTAIPLPEYDHASSIYEIEVNAEGLGTEP